MSSYPGDERAAWELSARHDAQRRETAMSDRDQQTAQQIATDWLVELPDEMEFSKGVIRLLVQQIASALTQARAEGREEGKQWQSDYHPNAT